jgi:chromosome partitioning protein
MLLSKNWGNYMDLMGQLWQWVVEKFITTLIVVPVFGYLIWFTLRSTIRLLLQAWHLFNSRQRALDAVGRDGLSEGKGVWLTTPIEPPRDYWRGVSNSKILAIANLKGGVGKTTLAANIGAYFAKNWQKRVLLIDLDFQGSLSSMAFPGNDWLPASHQSSLATRLISGDIAPIDVGLLAQTVNLNTDSGAGRLQVITAYYDLAQADNRIMIEWLLRHNHNMPKQLRRALLDLFTGQLIQTPDVRYTLAKVLHSEAVQKDFDLIIIDCPPRLTTSKIQAFCASSHLLVPTIFDRISAEAVVSLRDQVETLRSGQICPHIKYVGVVGTMWKHGRVAQKEAETFITDALGKDSIGILPESTFIPHAAALVNDASEGIAYIAMPNGNGCQEIRRAIAQLSKHIAAKMGISQDTYFREAAE